MRFSYNHPWPVLIFLALILILAALRIPHLRTDPSAEGMMVENDPAGHFYKDTVKTFGTDKISVIFVRDDKLFTPEKLKLLDNLVFDRRRGPTGQTECLAKSGSGRTSNLQKRHGHGHQDFH